MNALQIQNKNKLSVAMKCPCGWSSISKLNSLSNECIIVQKEECFEIINANAFFFFN